MIMNVMSEIVHFPLEKNEDGLYPIPTMRCGVLPYFLDKDNQIIWGGVESNRVGIITITPPAGIQDIIVMKNKHGFKLEVGKPFPDLKYDFLQGFIGVLFRDQAYQDIVTCLIDNKFSLYVENPLATALHETQEEHGIDLRYGGRDHHLLNALWELPVQKLSGKQGATAHYTCIAFLKNSEGVKLHYSDKVEKKIRRNLGRAFYEKGCWGTVDSFKVVLAKARATFNSFQDQIHYTAQQIDLIKGTLSAYQEAIEDLECKELIIRSDLGKVQPPLFTERFSLFRALHPGANHSSTANYSMQENPYEGMEHNEQHFISTVVRIIALSMDVVRYGIEMVLTLLLAPIVAFMALIKAHRPEHRGEISYFKPTAMG